MTTINQLSRSYDKLKREERLNLILDAIKRDDNDQADRLTVSAPMGDYRQRDAWTMGRVDSAFKISILYWLSIEEIFGSITQARFIKYQFEVELYEEDKSEKGNELLKKHIASADEMILSSLNTVKSLKGSVKRLAEEIGIDAQLLLAYVPSELIDKLNKLESLGRTLFPNDSGVIDDDKSSSDCRESLDEYYTFFRKFWPKN